MAAESWPNAEAAANSPQGIALEPGSLSHISESGPFGADLMSPALTSATNAHISALDLGILQDIGIAIRQPTSGDDDIYAIYGSDLHLGAGNDFGHAVAGGSALYGEAGNDTLYGDKGNDTLIGGAGNDTLSGGAGTDTALYSGLAANYDISRLSANSFRVKDLRNGSPDGTDTLSDVELLKWSDGTTTNALNALPIVTTANLTARQNQVLALSSLFTASDPAGLAITRYQVRDTTADPASGHFMINGVAQAAGTVIDLTPAQLVQASFVGGSIGDTLQIRALDSVGWSAPDDGAWASFTVSPPPANRAPVVTTKNLTAPAGQALAASSLFTVSDADGDAMTKYQLLDLSGDAASGHFVVGGVARPAGAVIEITAAQLAQTSFITGSTPDSLQIRAFDGTAWSAADNAAWSAFTVTPPVNHAPLVTTRNLTAPAGQTLTASGLFSVSDADGDTMTKYQLKDMMSDAASGHFVVGGVAKPAGAVIEITAAQLAQTSFVAGSVADSLQIRAYDGNAWSAADNAAWAPFTVAPPVNHAPVVTTKNLTAPRGQTLSASSLFTVSDADGDAMTKYQLKDMTADPASGHFVVNGVAKPAGTAIEITAAQLAQTSFVTGSVADSLQIRAFDGNAWSAADNASWAPFTLTPPVNHDPVVTAANIKAKAGQSVAASSLFKVSDADGDAITEYQFMDLVPISAAGHFVVNGVAQAPTSLVDVTAAQLAQTSFVAGTIGGTLQVRAFDGTSWSAPVNGSWAMLTVGIG